MFKFKNKQLQMLVTLLIMLTTGFASAAGSPAPKIVAAPASVNFGNCKLGDAPQNKVITIQNKGTAELTVTSIDITGINASDFTYTTDCNTLSPAASCSANITYTSSLPYTSKTAVLTIHSDDPRKSSLLVKLAANVKPPKISIKPMSVNFGTLKTGIESLEKSITVKNTGISDLVLSGATITGANASDFSVTNNCSSLTSGQSCSITILFSPSIIKFKSNASLEVTSNDPKKSVSIIKLTGTTPADFPSQNRVLSVNTFGVGTITDEGGSLNCSQNCTQTYQVGKTVTLTATPDTGWQLHHWSGCDTINGTECTVTMTSNKNVYPTFSSTVTTLQTNVKQLDDTTMALLKGQSGSTLIFDITASSIAALQPGDVIISSAGEGIAKKVLSVDILNGSAIYVQTRPASLQEIIQDGTVIMNQEMTYNNIQSATPLIKGVQLVKPTTKFGNDISITLDTYLQDDPDDPTSNSTKISGTATVGIETDFAFHASLFEGVKQFRTAFKTREMLDLNVSYGLFKQTLWDEKKTKWELYNFKFAPVTVGPIVLIPETKLILKLSGEAQSAFEAGANFTLNTTTGIQYLKSTGWSGILDTSPSFSIKPASFNGSVGVKASLVAENSVKIYGAAGPDVSVGPFISAKADVKNLCTQWGIYAGLSASAGADVSIIGFDLAKYDVNLFDKAWPIQEDKFGICSDSEPPTTPQNLTGIALSKSSIKLTWDQSTDNGLVSGYKIFRDDQELAKSSENTFVDDFLTTNKTYCYTVAAYDASGNTSEKSDMVCPKTKAPDTVPPSVPGNVTAAPSSTTANRIAWNAATDNDEVVGYVIYRDGAAITAVQDALSTYDTSLKPGTTYCYSVRALDAAGNLSSASNQACAKTLTTGAWNLYIACQGQPYVVTNNFDLNEDISSNIQVTGVATDYNGTEMAYIITGLYENLTKILNGDITFTFEGGTCIRKDEFSADLSTGDSGDTVMNQIQVCGCTATIRFSKDQVQSVTNIQSSPFRYSSGLSFK